MTTDRDRLEECLGGPYWQWLRQRLRRTYEADKPPPPVMSKSRPDAGEWQAANALLGRKATPSGKTLRVDLVELEGVLQRAGICETLRDAVECLDGPLVSRPAEAERVASTWRAVDRELLAYAEKWPDQLARYRAQLIEYGGPHAARELPTENVEAFVAEGTLRTVAKRDPTAARRIVDGLAAVFEQLAGHTGTAAHCAQLAARALGDSHALDAGTAVYRALAKLAGCAPEVPGDVWRFYGVANDGVSSSALVLNLRFAPGGLGTAVNGFADAGEPCRLAARHMDRLGDPSVESVHICENPAVLEAAANHYGAAGRPMLCTEGQPALACQELLTRCARQGMPMFYHGDFDWGGIRIANFLWQLLPNLRPWQFDAVHYRGLVGGCPLTGDSVDARWDPELAPAMQAKAQAFHEEQLLDALLTDVE